jgi:hypothetical protein
MVFFCTQRPDKVDPLVLSECENKAILKLGSHSVLNISKQLLGLEDVPASILSKTLEFEAGRAVLIGRWSPTGPELMYTAMRRTVEGGRNLRESHWATPFLTEPEHPAPHSGIGTKQKEPPNSAQ